MSALPPPGRWALGADAQALAEALVAQAQREGLRTGWLSAEAGFLSNLNILENLQLFHDWVSGDGRGFDTALARASAQLSLDPGEWLHARPGHLRQGALLRARLLRLLLLQPGLVVLHPALLAQAGPALAEPFIAGLAGGRLLLLADPGPDWPAWPPAPNESAEPAASRSATPAGPAPLAPAAAPRPVPAADPAPDSDPDLPAAAEDVTP